MPGDTRVSSQHTRQRWISNINIRVDGTKLDQPFIDALVEAVVDTTLHLPAMFTLRFVDSDRQWLDDGPFKPGAAVEIMLAQNRESAEPVIKGEITAIEPVFNDDLSVNLVIRGYDRSHRLNRASKSQVFAQMSDDEIVSKIARDAGLQVETTRISQAREHVFQNNLTDLAFIQHLARRNGFEFFVDDRKLYFRKPEGRRGDLSLTWGGDLKQFQPRLSLARQVDKVIVRGWDPMSKSAVMGEATRSQIAPEVNVGGSAGDVLREAFSAATQVVVRRPVTSQEAADALAQSILDDINAGFVEAEGMAEGNPELLAGKKITIENVGKRFGGEYMITSAVHVYTGDGYEVMFRVEGARARLMADLLDDSDTDTGSQGWGGVVPAVVTNNRDERDMGRVKVKFPWLDDNLESDWVRIVGIGAGNERGFFWLPEVNDEVLVAFENGDFNHPYVIGSLWNGEDKPPEKSTEAVQGGKVETRTIKTRAGHMIQMVDRSGQEAILIQDSSGDYTIHLDIAGRTMKIDTQGKLEISTGQNASMDIGGNLDINGQGNITVQANGQLVLKGATVNIN